MQKRQRMNRVNRGRKLLRRLTSIGLLSLGLHSLVSCGGSDAFALSKPGTVDGGPEPPTTVRVDIEQDFVVPDDTRPITTKAPKFLEHPYLIASKEEMAKVVRDVNNPSQKRSTIFQAIKKAVDAETWKCPPQGLSSFGMCYAVTGDKRYAEAVYKCLQKLAAVSVWEDHRDRESSRRIIGFSHGLDLCYDYLKTKSDYNKLLDKLALETFKMWQAATQPWKAEWRNWWAHDYAQNHFHLNLQAVVLGSLALKFEGSRLSRFDQKDVDKWLSSAKDEWLKAHEILAEISDGSWYEGTLYEETTLGHDMPPALEALARIEGLDLITTSKFMRMAPVFWIYNTNPEKPRHRLAAYGDGGTSWSRKNGLHATLRLCARWFGDSQAQWAADQLVKVSKRHTLMLNGLFIHSAVLELVYYDDTVKSRSPDNAWNESWHAQDLEMAFMRTGWRKGGLHAALKAGKYGGRAINKFAKANLVFDGSRWREGTFALGGDKGLFPQDLMVTPNHAHPDNNGFYILRNGVMLAPEGGGYDESHGTPWGRFTSSHNTITVDGRGQIGEGKVHPIGGNDREDFFKNVSHIPVFAPTDNFDLSVGDASTAYPQSLGVKEFRRHFFFLKPDYFVVFDSLDASKPKQYDWFCHFTERPTFQGRWIRGLADDGQILGINVVSPKSYSTQAGTRGETNVGNQYIDKDSTLHFGRIGVRDISKTRFITVLYPTNTGEWAKRPDVEKIFESHAAAGVRVVDSSGAEDSILCAYNATGRTTIGAFELDGLGAVVRKDAAGKLVSVYLAVGTHLREGNDVYVHLNSEAKSFEATVSGAVVEVSGEGITSFELFAPGVKTVRVNGQEVAFSRNGNVIKVK